MIIKTVNSDFKFEEININIEEELVNKIRNSFLLSKYMLSPLIISENKQAIEFFVSQKNEKGELFHSHIITIRGYNNG